MQTNFPRKYSRAMIVFSNDPIVEGFRKNITSRTPNSQKLFSAFLENLLSTVTRARNEISFDVIIASGDGNLKNNLDLSRYQFENEICYYCQSGSTFGERYQNTLKDTFNAGYEKVIIVGNDCPDLSASIITNSFKQLDENDIVIGPATDGGFYLFGSKIFNSEIFNNVKWLSSSVFSSISSNVVGANLSAFVLPALSDIDNFHSLKCWFSSNKKLKRELCRLLYSFVVVPLQHRNEIKKTFLTINQNIKYFWQIPPPLPHF